MKDEKYYRSKEFTQYIDKIENYDQRCMIIMDLEDTYLQNVKDIFNVVQEKWIQSLFQNASNEIIEYVKENGQMEMNASNYVVSLIQSIGKYQMARSISDQGVDVYRTYHRKIKDLLMKVSPLKKNSVLWMFEKNKDSILKAASELEQVDGFLSSMEQIEKEIKQIEVFDFISDFKKKEAQYCEILNGIVKQKVYDQTIAFQPDFKKLNEELNNMEEISILLETIFEKEKTLVKNIVGMSSYIKKETCHQQMGAISIDEVKRMIPGIRLNALKEEGFQTMADLDKASVIQLGQIHGISDEGAYRLKNVVHKFERDVEANSHVQLNPDKSDTYQDDLVQNLYSYILYKDDFEKAKQWNQDGILEIIQFLKDNNSKLKWVCSSVEKKKKIQDSIQTLENLDKQKMEEWKYSLSTWKDMIPDVAVSWEAFHKQAADFYAVLDQFNPGVLQGASYYGLPENLAKQIEDEKIFPNGLLVSLRRYQEWGVKYILHQKKVLLGDEMGLGKTIQAIACMVSLKNVGATHFMVVCPLSVLINWCREIETKSRLDVVKIHGQARQEAFQHWLNNGGVAVTTYETTGYISLPKEFKYSMLVVDEAHFIKNPLAHRSIHVTNISKQAEQILFMTGTALENNVDEMVKLIQDLQPDVGKEIEHMKHISNAQGFKEKVAGVYYRRKREDVLNELPDLIEKEEWCELLEEEKKLYHQSIQNKKFADARRVSWNVENLNESSKALRLKEIVEQAKEDNRKVIVFSFFLDTIQKIKSYLGDICLDPITGSTNPEQRQRIIDTFDDTKAGSVLLAQIIAGGTGLNIQSASVIVICEPQFKPSIENQAISRAYRMGQTQSVFVHRLLCVNTVDEKISKLLQSKQEIFDAFADDSISAKESLELDQTSFQKIIEEEIERIKKEGYA